MTARKGEHDTGPAGEAAGGQDASASGEPPVAKGLFDGLEALPEERAFVFSDPPVEAPAAEAAAGEPGTLEAAGSTQPGPAAASSGSADASAALRAPDCADAAGHAPASGGSEDAEASAATADSAGPVHQDAAPSVAADASAAPAEGSSGVDAASPTTAEPEAGRGASSAGETDSSPDPAPAEPASTLGQRLRAERERQGLEVGEVARQLKLAPRQVRALEDDDHAALPGIVFVRGFLRNYARALGLDADAMVRELSGAAQVAAAAAVPPAATAAEVSGAVAAEAVQSPPVPSLNVPVDRRAARRRSVVPWVAVALVVLIVAGAYLASRAPRRAPVAESPQPEVAQPVVERPSAAPPGPETAGAPGGAPVAVEAGSAPAGQGGLAPAAPAPAPQSGAGAARPGGDAGVDLRMSFTGDSWVEVRDADGQLLFGELVAPGGERAVRGKAPLEVVVGNAPGVALTLRGKPVDLVPHTRAGVARLKLE